MRNNLVFLWSRGTAANGGPEGGRKGVACVRPKARTRRSRIPLFVRPFLKRRGTVTEFPPRQEKEAVCAPRAWGTGRGQFMPLATDLVPGAPVRSSLGGLGGTLRLPVTRWMFAPPEIPVLEP